jgi:hypothetical protein
MRLFKIDLKDKEPEKIEVPDHFTTEGWWAAVKQDRNPVILNGKAYLKEEIIAVTEEKLRHGFTNMEGV